MRTAAINLSLQRTITTARLDRYLIEMQGDLDGALALYEYNLLVSESFYTVLQCLEVCLRNTLDECLSVTYGADWMTNSKAAFSFDAQNEILKSYQELGGNQNLPHGAIIAQLKFAFWVGLLGPRYDATLWRQSLHQGFKATTGKKRSDAHGRINAIRRFRNRVAHHEPIYHKDLTILHAEILEAISWMCKDTMAWAKHHSRVLSLLR